MIPATYQHQIVELLQELHGISVFGLTFAGNFGYTDGQKTMLRERREGGISDRYRAAIDHKLKRSE